MIPLQISFHDMEPSEAVQRDIQNRVEKLERLHPRAVSCEVQISSVRRRQHMSTFFEVTIRLGVPGNDIVVSHDPGRSDEHTNVYIAIRDAFQALERQVKKHTDLLRGDVKADVHPPLAKVKRLFPEDDYGFLETADGREIYFHAHSVAEGNFEELQVGHEVRFQATDDGIKGPQASTVKPVGKSGRHENDPLASSAP